MLSEEKSVLITLGKLLGEVKGINDRLERFEDKQDQALEVSHKIQTTCAVRAEWFEGIEGQVQKLEKKHVLGGTKPIEKFGIVLGAFYTLLRIGQTVWTWARSG